MSELEFPPKRNEKEHVINMIARMPEFHYFTKKEVARFATFDWQTFKRNETLMRAGEVDSKALVVLLAGRCSIQKPVKILGKTVVVPIEKIYAPAVLGEVGVFSSLPRTANVVSDTRSAGLILPVKTLRLHFEQSKATFPHLLWSFARLGVLRIRFGVLRHEEMTKKLVDCPIFEKPPFMNEVIELEALIGDEYDGKIVSMRDFDYIRDLVERVDVALAYAKHFENIEDEIMPVNDSTSLSFSASRSFLSVETLIRKESQGKNIKSQVVETCSKDYQKCFGSGDWTTCLEGLIEATDDLKDLKKVVREYANIREAAPGTDIMIEGFSNRICAELDKVGGEACKRFALERLPETLKDDPQSAMLEAFLGKKIKEVKARVLVTDFENGIFDEYYRSGKLTRNQVARAFYEKLKDHAVVSLISSRFPDVIDENGPIPTEEIYSLLDFIILGHTLYYPQLIEPYQKDHLNL
ncbi:hypothetical protein MNBD_NITROSPINAE02-2240 [hydrothermal vent metagenome]|uniref:Cyclic nucleotide-binding domain-containing protein n=1 Tax=hydrothermal vent metagenome TaxID=652676 RepID=A0A3B1C0J7_9ZZZZ